MRGANLVKLLKTIDLISSHRGATVEQIAEELEVSIRSSYRLLGVIEELGFLVEDIKDPIENRTRKRLDREFHQKIGHINLPDIKLTPSELIGLYLLKGEGRTMKDSTMAKSIDSAYAKIGMFAPKRMAEKLSKLQSLFLLDAKMSKSYRGKEQIIDQLTDAMLAEQTCLVTYHSFYDDKKKNFKIDPLHFFEHQGGLYLFVNATSFGNIRVLAVERIIKVKSTDDKFDYPEDFDPDDHLKHTFGLVYDDQLDVEIWFSADQARYIKERIWSPSQEIIDHPDGSIILKMRTSGRFEIKRWVLGYGAEAEVLKPTDLREEIRGDVALLYGIYQKA